MSFAKGESLVRFGFAARCEAELCLDGHGVQCDRGCALVRARP